MHLNYCSLWNDDVLIPCCRITNFHQCIGLKRRRQWEPTLVTLAWKIPWTEEPGMLQSKGSWRVRHDWATSLWLFTFMHWRRKWQPLQCDCLENLRDGGAWWAAIYGVAQSRTRLKWLSSSSYIITLVKDVYQFSQSIARQRIEIAVASHNGNMIKLTI